MNGAKPRAGRRREGVFVAVLELPRVDDKIDGRERERGIWICSVRWIGYGCIGLNRAYLKSLPWILDLVTENSYHFII